MSLCEWDRNVYTAADLQAIREGADPIGCEEPAAIEFGNPQRSVTWRLCATCAELPRFRRYRVARVLGSDIRLRRDSAGWWVDGLDFPDRPAPLAEVLERFPSKKEAAP